MLKLLLNTLRRRRRGAAFANDPTLIDVQRLIAELSDEELMHSADAYFARMTLASEQCWKPFSNPGSAVHITRHLGLVLEAADLFRGASVLDFGCATGWLTLGLSQMGCDAVGVDISPAALKLAGQLQAATPMKASGRGKPVKFMAYDGVTLPLADESVDRIICFDAFHHVRDQRHTLHEFARVLKKGGRAAFMEPGPNHSKTPQSQAEMAQHKVIENDVCMKTITRHALEAGLDKPQMLVQFQQPLQLDVDEFNEWARAGVPLRRAAGLKQTLEDQLTNGQCFFIYKGQPVLDSRSADGLAGELVLRGARSVAGAGRGSVLLELELRNTGRRDWITAAVPGQVNLGVQLLSATGRLVNNNYARMRLPSQPVPVGGSTILSGKVPMPEAEDFQFKLDLVAERVAWFSNLGSSKALTIASADLKKPPVRGA